MSHGGRQRNLARPEPPAGGEQRVALAEVEARAADVPRLDRAFADEDPGPVALCILLNDDRVGAFGDGRAGENAHRLAGANAAAERMSRSCLPMTVIVAGSVATSAVRTA